MIKSNEIRSKTNSRVQWTCAAKSFSFSKITSVQIRTGDESQDAVPVRDSPRDKKQHALEEPFDVIVERERIRNAIDKEFNKTRIKVWKTCHAAVLELRRTVEVGRPRTETVCQVSLQHCLSL